MIIYFLFDFVFLLISSIFQKINLTRKTAPITVTNAVLDGQQVNNIYVIDVNQTFDISVTPIDRITRRQIAKLQWGNWTWKANATLSSLPIFNPQGKLIKIGSLSPIINSVTKTITIRSLTINNPGMYILDISLISTNNEHVIALKSNGILVKDIDDGKN